MLKFFFSVGTFVGINQKWRKCTNKMKLNASGVKAIQPRGKTFKVADGGGLFLEVRSNGAKYWRLSYRYFKKQKTIALGVYPAVSLKDARLKRDDAKKLLAEGHDPGRVKADKKRAEENTFRVIAHRWHGVKKSEWTPRHAKTNLSRLENHVFPHVGDYPITKIDPPTILRVLRRIEARGNIDTTKRIKQICGQVFRFAISEGLADRDPTADLQGVLKTAKQKHMATLTDPKEVGGLLRAIEEYQGSYVTRSALMIAPLVFLRPGNIRTAEWSEIDFDKREWVIPAEKMKTSKPHIVPLSKQAIAILQDVHKLTGHGRLVFPGERSKDRPMSNNTLNAALRRMGYSKDEQTAHGFRGMASTLLNELGWPPDAIERQLAHTDKNKVRAAYNHSELLPARVKMMQAWADYLDQLKQGAEIIPINASM